MDIRDLWPPEPWEDRVRANIAEHLERAFEEQNMILFGPTLETVLDVCMERERMNAAVADNLAAGRAWDDGL